VLGQTSNLAINPTLLPKLPYDPVKDLTPVSGERAAVRIGERLPLNRGAPGRVILAFSGAAGEPYESIRKRGFHISLGEREPEVASVAAPVFAFNWRLLGSMCISGPSSRLTKAKLEKHAKAVIRAANQLSYALAGSRSAATPAAVSRWQR
jgi:DNA-binding IclR family transcriptional regulator